MRLVCHRGARGLALENSLEAINIGVQYQPDLIEVDINQTGDDVFIVHHGDIPKNLVGSKLGDSLKNLRKDNPKLLTLDQLLKQRIGHTLLLDIKVKNDTKSLINLLKKFPDQSLAFTGLLLPPLIELQSAFPGAKILLGCPHNETPFRTMRLALKYGFSGVSLSKWWVGPITYHLCNRWHLEVMYYSVNSKLLMTASKYLFSESLICTDRPDKYREITVTTKPS